MAAPMESVLNGQRLIRLVSRQLAACRRMNEGWRRLAATNTQSGDTQPKGPGKSGVPVSRVGYAGAEKAQKISKAMKAYLERAKAHDAFMHDETADYEIGKRHLANMMGEDPETFDQEQIDIAIEYLLPSGVFDRKARPVMKHPSEVIPKRKAAQFGVDGRPFHFLFYTGMPNFYQLMHDVSVKMDKLKAYENKMAASGVEMPPAQKHVLLAGSEWIQKRALEDQLQEKIAEQDYIRFVRIMERLSDLPYCMREKEFILNYRTVLSTQTLLHNIPPLQHDDIGRSYMDAIGARKKARAEVRVWGSGTGTMTINGQDQLAYFPRILDREQLMFPLQFTELLGEVDVEAKVEGGGPSGQAGALRLALARALQSFVDKAMVEKMRLAGLLTQDPRQVERQKPGQSGARRKFTWKKR